MGRIVLAVTHLSEAEPIRTELATYGHDADVVEGCDNTLELVERVSEQNFNAVVVDSRLVRRVAKDKRDLVQELQAKRSENVPILVYMTKAIDSIDDPIVKEAVGKSDAFVDAPASAPDIHLSLLALSSYGTRPKP